MSLANQTCGEHKSCFKMFYTILVFIAFVPFNLIEGSSSISNEGFSSIGRVQDESGKNPSSYRITHHVLTQPNQDHQIKIAKDREDENEIKASLVLSQYRDEKSTLSYNSFKTARSVIIVDGEENLGYNHDVATIERTLPKPRNKQRMQTFLTIYSKHLEKYPLLNKLITVAIIGICGDALSQYFQNIKSGSAFDMRRNIGVFLEGVLISGPLMHFTYDFYETILPVKQSGKTMKNLMAASQVVLDCFVMDPLYVLSAILTLGLFEGFSLNEELIPQLLNDFFPSVKAAWASSLMLSPIQFLAVRFLPVNWRFLAICLQGILWNAVVFFMAHRNR